MNDKKFGDMMFAAYIYNMVNIVAWVLLAHGFHHWWIAMFAVLTMSRPSVRYTDDGEDDPDCGEVDEKHRSDDNKKDK